MIAKLAEVCLRDPAPSLASSDKTNESAVPDQGRRPKVGIGRFRKRKSCEMCQVKSTNLSHLPARSGRLTHGQVPMWFVENT